jgi:transposase, IS5 family
MSNRFERSGGGFLDLAVSQLKKAKSFLEDVDRFVDWRPIEKLLKKELRRNQDAIGNPAYPPLAMFKVLLLQRWWNLSDQGMDDALSDRISFRRFAGFSFGYDTPDSTTICRFRNHLAQRGLEEKLFGIINHQLQAKKLIVKQGIIVDASIVESSRRPRKVEVVEESQESQENDPHYDVNTTYSEDHEARWTIKAKKPYYGYKIHISTDADHGFIVGGHATPANRADTKELMEVVKEAGAPKGSMVFADKGYASADNRCSLEENGLTDGIMYKAAKGKELSEAQKLMNKAISRLRGKVERAFGTLKRDYGFRRARYLGTLKVKLEFMLNAMAFNLKKAALMME